MAHLGVRTSEVVNPLSRLNTETSWYNVLMSRDRTAGQFADLVMISHGRIRVSRV